MNMLLNTYRHLLADIVRRSGIHLDAPDTLTMSWVLIEGPALDKQLLRYIEHGGTESPSFPHWLVPLWEAFVVTNDACMLRCLRQLLVFCYKAEFEPSEEQKEVALRNFLTTDEAIDIWDSSDQASPESPLLRQARLLIGQIIYKANWAEIVPAHGPGAVFPSRVPVCKSDFRTLYARLQELYPYDQYFCGIPSFWWDVIVDGQGRLREEDSIVANLVFVPKDSRGPRTICVHPAEAIWIQQGQRRVLERCITGHYLTSSKINFEDQSVNGRIALESSRTKEFVTLDLKDASDRLSAKLVKFLFGGAYKWLGATRAEYVTADGLDDCYADSNGLKGHWRLRKFAPMGNCLTFPVQSLVFWALVRAGIRSHYGVNCNDVYVFGDDILYPSKYHTGALMGLVRAGLVPNMDKTFRLGSFRESCGVDAYGGIDITPYRMKVRDANSYSNCVSLCDLAKRLRLGGYSQCSSYIYSQVRRWMGKLHLSSNPSVQGIVEYVCTTREVLMYESSLRFNRGFQRWETRRALLAPTNVKRYVHDWYHVQDSLLRIARRGDLISDRGTEYTTPYRERLEYGWTPAYL